MRIAVAIFPLLIAAIAHAEPVRLVGEAWTIEIDAATLGARATPAGGEPITIALPLKADEKATVPTQRDGVWTWTTQGISVAVKLERDALVIDFTADAPGDFTWPLVPGDQGEFILPMFEGLCVPTDDPDWIAFLKDHGPLNTTGDLSMPFFATLGKQHSISYFLPNAFNNAVRFDERAGELSLSLQHTFTRNNAVKAYGLRIELGEASPVEPAKRYRQSLIDSGQFVTMKEKIRNTPEAEKLLGAAHIYLWGDETIAVQDVRDFGKLMAAARSAGSRIELDGTLSPGERLWSLIGKEAQDACPQDQEVITHYAKRLFIAGLNQALTSREFHNLDAWKELRLDPVLANEIADGVTAERIVAVNAQLLISAFPDCIAPIDTWGNGFSTTMIDAFVDAKLDRLWLGSPNWKGLADHPAFTANAKEAGYLVGPYDSYHSIHSPSQADTWETAQFDQPLFDTGGVVLADGATKKGFKQRGAILSPLAARPYVEERVNRLAKQFGCNSWFIDCDATGEVFDDYSPAHPATQREDTAERLSRLAWIRDAHQMVIGSEGGAAYAAPVIHFAHGMMTPVIGWGDEQMMKDKTSPFYIGAYYPPDAPATFFKRVPMKPTFQKIYADPRYRVPLYQVVFHDSVIATYHWGYGSLKFVDEQRTRELLELLYNVPPLYHLNRSEWTKQKAPITKNYQFFSPLHRECGLLPLADFRWLTPDRSVQLTRFGDRWELIANFSDDAVEAEGFSIPPRSIAARDMTSGDRRVYP